ncbi:efflux RND transporter periplasmic adaptor subunit [Stutzerimonas azotifigens]|uniref:Efflux RND transporter periplasmic adaptor subunit n=1 Tax=Stutzerimonas azotifigens TaxID=291995 RepID=A0ABR5YYH3_9GAMM|nr:efflux RND transporter periplasmic adaptor subunit [Stutzerimonas azotifigens]MBA1272961.1 efflux RND transporter periplasmic adaptor subunit [Stutzerimonas azotifigens]
MPRSTRTRLLFAVALALVAGGGYFAYATFYPSSTQSRLLTADVSPRNIEQSVIATGTLEAFEQVSVGAQVSGQIKTLAVAIGDPVKKGDLIAEIDSLTQQNALKNAQAALANVKAQRAAKVAALKQAQLAFDRQKRMLEQQASAREDFEAAEATLATGKAEIAALDAQIEQAQIQVSTAELDLGYTRIVAPIDGTVVGVLVKEGQTVNSAQSAPTLVKLAQLDKMTVKAEISEADVVRVAPGQPVYFTTLGEPDKRYRATLRSVEPAPASINTEDSASSSTSSSSTAIYYNGVFDVPNEEGRLRISMTAEVYIVLAEARGVPTIPVAALGRPARDGSYSVQVLQDDGRIVERSIRTGLEDSLNVEVTEGLSLNERIVLGDSSQATASPVSGRRGPPGMRL